MTTANSLGITVGLVFGKPLGILLFCWALIKFSKISLPAESRWKNMVGASVLAGIGFTMSIFISNIAFPGSEASVYSKVAVLLASGAAAAAGLAIFFSSKKIPAQELNKKG